MCNFFPVQPQQQERVSSLLYPMTGIWDKRLLIRDAVYASPGTTDLCASALFFQMWASFPSLFTWAAQASVGRLLL